jgi:Protein of unknown function (DUF1778)
MSTAGKTTQLQIRVSRDQKEAIARAAKRAGIDMSAYVLGRVLGAPTHRFGELMRQLDDAESRSYALAELHDLLCMLGADELRHAVAEAPPPVLATEMANYVAAMVETACVRAGVEMPAWTRSIPPLETPMFASQLESLRLHLLANSPPAFRRRNIFIDTTLGGRV